MTIDGDLQDDPAEIPRLLDELEAGADLVSGWKRDRKDPFGKRAASRVFNGVTSRMSGVELHDLNCGFKAYRAEVVESLALTGDQYRYIPVLAAAEGFRVSEIPVHHRPRIHGRSKYGLERYLRGFLDLLTILFIGRLRQRPMHLFGGVGMLFIATGVVICAYLGHPAPVGRGHRRAAAAAAGGAADRGRRPAVHDRPGQRDDPAVPPAPPGRGGAVAGRARHPLADAGLSRAGMRASGPWPGPPADRRTAFGGAGAGNVNTTV